MINRYTLSIILCLWASCAWAFPPGFIGVIASMSGAPSWVETFNTTVGYDHTWATAAGSPNPDSATVVVSGQSLALPLSSSVLSDDIGRNIREITFVVNFPSANTSTKYAGGLINGSGEYVMGWQFVSMTLKVTCGTPNATSVTSLATGKTRVWIRYLPGTGGNAVVEGRFAAYTGSETRPTAAAVSLLTGQSQTEARKIGLSNTSGSGITLNLDNVEVVE